MVPESTSSGRRNAWDNVTPSKYLHRHVNDEPIAILDIDDAVSLQVDHRD
jgi:hypothetical protein